MLPFGGPDGQGPVLVPLLIRGLIIMPPFGSPDGQNPVLVTRIGIRECFGYTQATTKGTSGAPRAGGNAPKCDLATPATSGGTSGGPKQTGTVNRRKPVGAARGDGRGAVLRRILARFARLRARYKFAKAPHGRPTFGSKARKCQIGGRGTSDK